MNGGNPAGVRIAGHDDRRPGYVMDDRPRRFWTAIDTSQTWDGEESVDLDEDVATVLVVALGDDPPAADGGPGDPPDRP